MIIKVLLWLASTIEDKAGSISTKRIGFLWCLYMLNKAVKQPEVNDIVIYAIVVMALGLAGLTIPEWFSQIRNKAKSEPPI